MMSVKPELLSATEFCERIESLVKADRIGYYQAIAQYCEERGIDVESVFNLVNNSSLKARLTEEGVEKNMVRVDKNQIRKSALSMLESS